MPMRRGDEDLVPVDGEGHAEQFLDPLGDVDRAADVVDPVEQDGELVATDPGDGVAGPKDSARDGCAIPTEQLVADGVAEAVVDVLEAVEVEEEDGELWAGAPLRTRPGRTPGGP